jgi:hypothetical protein
LKAVIRVATEAGKITAVLFLQNDTFSSRSLFLKCELREHSDEAKK